VQPDESAGLAVERLGLPHLGLESSLGLVPYERDADWDAITCHPISRVRRGYDIQTHRAHGPVPMRA
jgi:hypothetical protein